MRLRHPWLTSLISSKEEMEYKSNCLTGENELYQHMGQIGYATPVEWDADFTFEDYGYEGEGLIHQCHCENCGAIITYEIPYEEE